MQILATILGLTLIVTGALSPAMAYARSGPGQVCDKPKIKAVTASAIHAWEKENWLTMYRLLIASDKRNLSYKSFSSNQNHIAKYEKVTDYRIVSVTCLTEGAADVKIALFFKKSPDTRFTWKGSKWYRAREGEVFHLIRQDGQWRFRLPERETSHKHP